MDDNSVGLVGSPFFFATGFGVDVPGLPRGLEGSEDDSNNCGRKESVGEVRESRDIDEALRLRTEGDGGGEGIGRLVVILGAGLISFVSNPEIDAALRRVAAAGTST